MATDTTPEPDKNLTPGQEGDAVAVYLAAAGERWNTAGNGTWEDYPTALELLSSALRSAGDVPRLLGAVTEVLALADSLITPQPGDSAALAACGRKLRRIISAELLRKETP